LRNSLKVMYQPPLLQNKKVFIPQRCIVGGKNLILWGCFKVHKEIQPDKWSNEEKFAVVLETSALAEADLNEYCRSKGLFPEQVKGWKQACIEGNKSLSTRKAKETAEQKSDKKQIKSLERELRRKDKALAEAAALIVLGKKYDAYWKEKEGD